MPSLSVLLAGALLLPAALALDDSSCGSGDCTSLLQTSLVSRGSASKLAAAPPPFLGGLFVDPGYAEEGTLKGFRFIADVPADASDVSGKLALVGTDDGETFWTLFGTWTDKSTGALYFDLSPKGVPASVAAMPGVWDGKQIVWKGDADHTWPFFTQIPVNTSKTSEGCIEGLWFDTKAEEKDKPLAGANMIGPRLDVDGELLVVGSDDSSNFIWASGSVVSGEACGLSMTTSEGVQSGKAVKGTLTWNTGAVWLKQQPNP